MTAVTALRWASILGPWPVTDQGNRYILVVGDYFTKWTEVYPLPNQEASTVASVFVPGTDGTSYRPRTKLLSRNFLRKFADFWELTRRERQRHIPYQSDGLIERANRTLENMLAIFINEKQTDWDRCLPYNYNDCVPNRCPWDDWLFTRRDDAGQRANVTCRSARTTLTSRQS